MESFDFKEDLKKRLLGITDDQGAHPLFIRQTNNNEDSVFVYCSDIKRLMEQKIDPKELLEPDQFALKVQERVQIEVEFSRQMAISKEKVLEAFRETAESISAQIVLFSLEVINNFPKEITHASDFVAQFYRIQEEFLPKRIKETVSYLTKCSEVPEYFQPYDPTPRIREELLAFREVVTKKLSQKLSNFQALSKQESPAPCFASGFEVLAKLPGEVSLGERGLALQSSDSQRRHLVALSKEGVLEMIEPKASKAVFTKRLKDFPADLENGVAFSPNGTMFAVSNHLMRSLRIFDSQTGNIIRTLLTPFHLLPPLTCFVWVSNSRLAIAYYSGEISCFSVSGRLISRLQYFSSPVFSMARSSKNNGEHWNSGDQLICGDGAYKTGRLFKISLSFGKVVWEKPKHHSDWIRCVTQGELVGLVASGGDDGVIKVIEEDTLALVYKFNAQGWVLNLKWSGCEQFLMVGSREEILAVKLEKGKVSKQTSLLAKAFQGGYEFRSISTNWESGYLVLGSQNGHVFKLKIFSKD